MNPLVLSVQLDKKAATQYTAFPFNSAAVFNGKVVLAGPSGIFTHEGPTDNGTAIEAYAELPPHRTGKSFRPRCIHLAGEGGNLNLTVTMDEGESRTYRLVPTKTGQHRSETKCQRVKPGGFMTVRVTNVLGSDFSVDSIDATLTEHGRRP